MDGMHIFQPTALAIKQAPSSSATVYTGGFPHALTITLRHIPQPENLSKSCGRTNYTTYQAFLVNTSLNTKTFLGQVGKLRPGTFRLVAENIPPGTWDQLVVSLAQDDPSDLGIPIFTYEEHFCNPSYSPEKYTALPADFPRTDQPTEEPCDTGLLKPGTLLPEQDKGAMSAALNSEDESMLLQPGTVLPEDASYAAHPDPASPAPHKIAPMDGPVWFDPDAAEKKQPEQSLTPLVLDDLPHHALWLVNYQGIQLVGYVYEASDPKKPLYIVHGVPGDHSRRAKPKEPGYEYWVADPSAKSGYWLRYVNPHDNLIVYPFPVKEGRK